MKLEKVLEELEDLIATELSKIVKKGELNPTELKNANDAMCLMDKVYDVYEKMGNLQNGGENPNYSERTVSMHYGGYRNPMTGRHTNIYNRGYSGHSIQDRMVDKLEHMMDEATSQYEKDTIAEWIEKLKA